MNRRDFLRSSLSLTASGLSLAGCSELPRRDGSNSGGLWDLHIHLAGFPGTTPEERMDAAVRYADRMGIERLVVFLGMSLGPLDPSPDEVRKANDECLRAIARRPDRAFGFVYLNPNHPEFCLRELDRCVRDGPMVGVKLWTARRCNDPALDPIVRRAAELKALVYQHTWFKTGGNFPGESTPSDLAALATRHPDVPLVCGHTGGNWELGIRSVRALPNVHLDLAGFDPTAGVVEMAVREVGPERILYGSDAGGRSFASQIGKVSGSDVPESAKRLILRDNLRRLLNPILRIKGITA